VRVRCVSQFRYTWGASLMALLLRAYRSDAAFTAGLLLAFGLVGATMGMWLRLLS